MRTYEHTALILAAYLKAFGKPRLRISGETFRKISGRSTVKSALISHVRDWLEDYGVTIFELSRGGYALVAVSALEGAPTARLNDMLPNWKRLSVDDLSVQLGIEEADEE